MREVDGVKYYTIGEVGRLINRSPQTIKNWLEWHEEQSEDVRKENPLPIFRRDINKRQTRFIAETDVHLLKNFKENVRYGKLASTNRKKWGDR